MRLNLGAGKVIFPMKEADKPHPLVNLPDTSAEADWVNVDALALAGINQVVDLFAYPWPWACDSVTEIWASHICEHIPHEPRPSCGERSSYARWKELANLDGFYAFFAEAWRVLKPGGRITVVAPYGKCDGAIFDPQHTRQIVEQTFHYLGNHGANSPTYDYSLPLAFEATYLSLRYTSLFPKVETEEERAALRQRFWNVADEIICTLKVVK